MSKTLTYLFDPLCGWCYGAGGRLPQLIEATGLALEPIPTGLFAGAGARTMDDGFADYAWSNDQRIARLTGQVFSERYRGQVLADRTQLFDSGPASVALTAVYQASPGRVFEALEAIQSARYVEGRDITQLPVLAGILRRAGLSAAAAHLAEPDATLQQATQAWFELGRHLLRRAGAQGVPTFILDREGETPRVLHASAIFSNPQAFARELNEPD